MIQHMITFFGVPQRLRCRNGATHLCSWWWQYVARLMLVCVSSSRNMIHDVCPIFARRGGGERSYFFFRACLKETCSAVLHSHLIWPHLFVHMFCWRKTQQQADISPWSKSVGGKKKLGRCLRAQTLTTGSQQSTVGPLCCRL